MSQATKASLVGSVLERRPSSSPSAPSVPRSNANGGFPPVQHRSKSAFQRAREDQKKAGGPSTRLCQVPTVVPAPTTLKSSGIEGDEDTSGSRAIAEATEGWRKQMEDENQKRVEAMTEAEREAERKEILERFGPNVGEILRRARAAREAAQLKDVPGDTRSPRSPTGSRTLKSALASRAASPSPVSPDLARPPSRSDRQLRFADVTTKDVHVYESQPPSPKRTPLALMSPTEADGHVMSLGEFKGKLVDRFLDNETRQDSPMAVDPLKQPSEPELVDGTPEDIRRRYFPNAAAHDPSLAWIEDEDNPGDLLTSLSLRFDLSGNLISHLDAEKLPTHLGLHHHAEGKHAGYTLDDIFLLSRSTVPAQRASMLDLLSKIARQLSNVARAEGTNIKELEGQEKVLRKRMLAGGLETISERGTVGVRAVELSWVCIVRWDEDTGDVDGVELKLPPDDLLSPLPLEQYVLPQIADALKVAALPSETLLQLLDILHRLARHSNDIASLIVKTPKLLANVMQRFILLSPTSEEGNQPQPKAIELLIILAQSSRQTASVVAESTDPLLRFVVTLPSSSIHPEPLATALLTSTLRLYATLAAYGLYAQLATTAAEPLRALGAYVLSSSCSSESLREAWLLLLEAWMVCARDPHKTTPEHDIIWSQVTSWSWGEDVLKLSGALTSAKTQLWTALWRVESSWLEGTTVNAPKHGEAEKAIALEVLRSLFEGGFAATVVQTALQGLDSALASLSPVDIARRDVWGPLASNADHLTSSLRLWLACLPSLDVTSISAPPFNLPFAEISVFCARLTLHPLWVLVRQGEVPRVVRPYVRSLSSLLAAYLDFSRFLPGASEDLWLAQAFSIVCRLLPGDEERAVNLLEHVSSTINASFMKARGWAVPSLIWEKNGLEPILPFLKFSFGNASVRVGPLSPTPMSISTSTTLRLSAPAADSSHKPATLPVNRDWIFVPLDYLLRSGQSEVFKSLPSSWDFSETEIVRATLLLAKIHRQVLLMHGLPAFALSREETVFSCMKVFMLEHGQQQETSIDEVFRDALVGQFMADLLDPFSFAAASTPTPSSDPNTSLEEVAKTFLGSGTPFYQYYTDFVGLYDAISFSYPLFARLLLPPLSMRYPADYRKYLWADFSHVVRTIKTPVAAVVSGDVSEFLWPLETNPDVVSAYLRALTKGHTEGFMHLVAVHHVACGIWPDLREDSGAEGDERAEKLLAVVAGQASPAVIKDIVSYRQQKVSVVLPPVCFEGLDGVRDARRSFVQRYGPAVTSRLSSLLE